MGAGAFRAGIGPAGAAPVNRSISLAMPNGGPAAALFDPISKTFPLDSNGNFISIHPVDQGVAMALCIRARAISSAPAQGHTLLDMPRGSIPSRQKEAEDRIKKALAVYLKNGDIQLLSIETAVQEGANPRLLAAVTYRNLRTSQIVATTSSL